MTHLLAIDQGTTSTRAIVFDAALVPVASAQQEFRQIYPAPGLGRARSGGDLGDVGRDRARARWRRPGSRPRTSPRSASPISARPRSSGTARPASRSTTPSSGRTAAPPTLARRCGAPAMRTRSSAKTGLAARSVFLGDQDRLAARSRRGRAQGGRGGPARLRHGRLVSCCGGSPAARCTRPTPPMRRAPLLLDIRTGSWDRELARAVRRSAGAAAARCATARRISARRSRELFGGPIRILRRRRRPAGGDRRAGLLHARHDEIDLRHRLLRAAQHRRQAGAVAQPAAHHHRLSARRQAHLRARRRDLHRRRRRAMAARRAEADRAGVRCQRARAQGRSGRAGLSGAGLRRTRRAVLGCARRAARCSG